MQINPQRRTFSVLLFTFVMLFAASFAYCSTTYYVDPNGTDAAGRGAIDAPLKTIPYTINLMVAGDTMYLRGGRHYYSAKISISKVGTSGAMYNLFAYPGEKPILDFSAMAENSSNRGASLSGSYWYIKGIDFYKAGDNGMIISGTYNRIELCNFYENRDSGLQLSNGAAYNDVINCDSYYNRDVGQGNADGFSPKLTVGTGNYFYGCRSWQNSDDAYDGYLGTADDVTTTYENCWAMKAGYLKDGSVAVNGNGNGFKMGGGTNYRHNVTLKNCLAFSNKAKGFDQNNNVGNMTLYNCTAFGNGGNNYNITLALASGKVLTLTNCANFTGTVSLGSFAVQTTNSWMSPFVVTSADFVSINPAAAYGPRNADGSLPDITFMHLAAGSDLIDGGTNVGLPYNGSKPDLGCFETGGSSLPGAATNPTPTNSATNVSTTQDISWTAGSGATSGDVYFGTEASPPLVSSGQAAVTYDTGTMTNNKTYYWRIDEKNAGGTTTGTVWSFTTVPASPNTASNPTPANSATDVSLTQDLSWTAGSGATSHDVYFGTEASPPLVSSGQTAVTYDTGTMVSSEIYYWRIDEKNTGGTTTGTVWNFTTLDNIPPTPNPSAWATIPAADGINSITMTAVTATDASGVEYYFANVTDPNHDSNWVASPVWTDTGLTNNTKYNYKVKARDMSANHNETGWSNDANATTLRFVCTNSVSADLTGDCQVNFLDFVRLADAWAGNPPAVDLNEDDVLDFKDIAKLALNWLTCNRNPADQCWQ